MGEGEESGSLASFQKGWTIKKITIILLRFVTFFKQFKQIINKNNKKWKFEAEK